MSSMKKNGGLTRGPGMTELQSAKWLLSTPTGPEIKCTVRTLSCMSLETSEQHKIPMWPLLVKSVSMLVQECFGGTIFSEILCIKKTFFFDMFGTKQLFPLRNKHLFSYISKFLIKRKPFEDRSHLVNIAAGEVANDTVNVFEAKNIGLAILEIMVGQSLFRYSYTRKDMDVSMSAKIIDCKGEQIRIDYQLFVHRLPAFSGGD